MIPGIVTCKRAASALVGEGPSRRSASFEEARSIKTVAENFGSSQGLCAHFSYEVSRLVQDFLHPQ